MPNQWYAKKWLAFSLHVLFWTLIFLSPYLLRPVMNSNNKAILHSASNIRGFYNLNNLNNLVRLSLFYANAFLFIPRLVYRKRYSEYLLVLMGALGIMLCWDYFFFRLFIAGVGYSVWNFFVFNIPIFLFFVIASAAFRIIRDRVVENQRLKEKENENLKTELSFLRSQVSPHFMFNIMNNMVALARKKSDLLEPSLLKLSSLLRYMLYETEEKVPLQKEIEYLQSYIDLQSQRFGDKVRITVCMKGGEGHYQIEPMLLIPFVENAFKHGTGLVTNAEIGIDLKVQDRILYFTVRNKYNDQFEVAFHNQLAVVRAISNKSNDQMAEPKDKTSGIGLANVQRRLDLLYRNKHSLLITKQNNWFVVSLQIALHE